MKATAMGYSLIIPSKAILILHIRNTYNARHVFAEGNFNGWNRASHPMHVRWDDSGIWELFISDIGKGGGL
jgi:hypothetical protein